MKSLTEDIILYIEHLKNTFSLDISFHFGGEIFGILSAEDAAALLKYNSHTNVYCSIVKARGSCDKCRFAQQSVLKALQDKKSLVGACYAGVTEYVHKVELHGEPVGFISVSGYLGEPHPPESADDGRRKYLKEGMPPQKLCQSVIPPLARMFELLLSQIPQNKEYDEFNRILAFISERRSSVCLDDICKSFHCSPSHVSHMFKKRSGMTLSAYCSKLRLEDSKSILLSTDLPVTEAAYASGFNDVSYFIRIFRQAYGVTPLRWRKMHR